MTPAQPVQEHIIVTVEDQSKLDFLMEFFSHFDLVKARREVVPPDVTSAAPNMSDENSAN